MAEWQSGRVAEWQSGTVAEFQNPRDPPPFPNGGGGESSSRRGRTPRKGGDLTKTWPRAPSAARTRPPSTSPGRNRGRTFRGEAVMGPGGDPGAVAAMRRRGGEPRRRQGAQQRENAAHKNKNAAHKNENAAHKNKNAEHKNKNAEHKNKNAEHKNENAVQLRRVVGRKTRGCGAHRRRACAPENPGARSGYAGWNVYSGALIAESPDR